MDPSHSAQERECETSVTSLDDGGGNDQRLPFSSRSGARRQWKPLAQVEQGPARCCRRKRSRRGERGDHAGRRRTRAQGAHGSTPSPGSSSAGERPVDPDHTHGPPGLDSLDHLCQARGNAPAPDRECLRHACLGKTPALLYAGHQLAHERFSRHIRRNVAGAAELKKSFFGEIDQVEIREDAAKLRTVKLGRGKRACAQPGSTRSSWRVGSLRHRSCPAGSRRTGFVELCKSSDLSKLCSNAVCESAKCCLLLMAQRWPQRGDTKEMRSGFGTALVGAQGVALKAIGSPRCALHSQETHACW